jgi:raffinose/stachyose/melibiose transport system substrate-binding protein
LSVQSTRGGRGAGFRWIVAVLALAGALALAACGGGTDDNDGGGGGGDAAGGEAVTLKATIDSNFKPALDPLIKSFEAANKGTTIDVTYAPVDQIQTSLRAQLGAGNAPDLFTVWPGNGSAMSVAQLSPANVLTDLTDQPWTDGIPDNFKPLLGTDGKILFWEPGVAVIGAVYNEEVFEKHHIEIPKTWSDVLSICSKLKSAGVVPIAVGNQTPWVTQLINYAIAPSTAFVENPNLAEDMLAGKKTFSNSGWRTVFERYVELQKKGCYNPNPNGTTLEQQIAMVANGKAAMAVHVSAVLPQFEEAAKGKTTLGMFPFPANDKPGDLKIPAGLSSGIGISATSKHSEQAKKFLAFVSEPDNLRKFDETFVNIPTSVTADSKVEPKQLQPFVSYIVEGKSVPFMDQQWPNAEVQPVHFSMVQEVTSGKTSISGALGKLDEAYKKK